MKKLTNKVKVKNLKHQKRSNRVKAKISANTKRPRLAIYRSNTYIYAQIIDDSKSHTLASASDLKLSEGNKTDRARKVWVILAENAKKAWIKEIAFDRNGYAYAGRVKALADSAREAGLDF